MRRPARGLAGPPLRSKETAPEWRRASTDRLCQRDVRSPSQRTIGDEKIVAAPALEHPWYQVFRRPRTRPERVSAGKLVSVFHPKQT